MKKENGRVEQGFKSLAQIGGRIIPTLEQMKPKIVKKWLLKKMNFEQTKTNADEMQVNYNFAIASNNFFILSGLVVLLDHTSLGSK